jgi:8-amino-7-oxononanoate synthase
MFAQRFKTRLTDRRQSGLYRHPPEVTGRTGKYLLVDGRKVLNFASNDYLGLGVSNELRLRTARYFQKYGTS